MKEFIKWLLEGDVDFKQSREFNVGSTKVVEVELKDKRKFEVVNNMFVSFLGTGVLTSQCRITELLVQHFTKNKFY